MRRVRLGVLTALSLALAGHAAAAEITRVASRGEPGNPFDLHITLRWDRSQERAQITREVPSAPTAANPAGGIADGDELRYTRTVNTVVPRVALGITSDLELHFEWPYVLGDDRTWRFGLGSSGPAGGVPGQPSTIESNGVNANGVPCDFDVDGTGPFTCPLFQVAPVTTVYHGGRAGDLKGGIAWGIFDDREDPTKPFWLVGFDVTFPTAARYDPAGDRGTSPIWLSPHTDPGKVAAVGEKVWKWDLHTVLSRRLGPIDPYVKAHVTLMSQSSSTYSNCEHAAELAGRLNPEMNAAAAANCATQGTAAGAKLPWIAGLTFGTELVPYENDAEQQRVAVDFRLFADYTSSQRFYNELTDASGKIHWTEEYLTMGGFLGVYLRASRYVSLNMTASLSTATPHWLTGETLGNGGSWPAVDPSGSGITTDPTQMNPNFDWRYDAPGRRFRLSEVANFALSFGGVLTF